MTTIDNDTSFNAWFATANRVCQGIAGVTLEDLADACHRDAFDDGMTPREWVTTVLAEEGFDFE